MGRRQTEQKREAMAEQGSLVKWAGGKRVTLAIVFTDIVRGTVLNIMLGDVRMKEVKDAHYARATTLAIQYNGRSIKTTGDGVLVVFKAISEALDFTLALHAHPGESELQGRVRAGIHSGEVHVKDADDTEKDIDGTEVNFAARVVSRIEDAEIWLSNSAKVAVDRLGAVQHKELEWAEHENVVFKGFESERAVTLWSLVLDSSSTHSSRSDETIVPSGVRLTRGHRR
jgi:class 3 adenylate cyclase